jgi:hypothetical protein
MERSGSEVLIPRLRLWLLGILIIGLLGTVVELVLLKHYEKPLQWVPLLLIAAGFVIIAWRLLHPDAASLTVMKVVWGLFVVSGFLGVLAHFNGSAAFQRELDPNIGFASLLDKVLHAQAPPLLAPGMMLQMGLIGLAYVFADVRFKGRPPA